MSPVVLFSFLIDLMSAGIVLIPPALLGMAIVPWCGLGPLPRQWRFFMGTALGLGLTALLVLAFGLLGLLNRTLWIAILALFTIVGVHQLRRKAPRQAQADGGTIADESREFARPRSLWFLLAPFVVLGILASANPPGFVWPEEGFGYDVLEYHLQVPKEYWQSGAISYLPHNVYANFPSNIEMLYLLCMVVHGNPMDLGTTANVVHLILGALAVYGAWLIAREWSASAGVVSAVATGSAGWLCYLSGLAYVEHGLLFFGAGAVGAILRGRTPGADAGVSNRWMLLGGILAGLACGCKYTAVAFVALPLAVMIVVLRESRPAAYVRSVGLFAIGCLLSFAPWLVKNLVMTGNPVFPLCNRTFAAQPSGWGEDQTLQWERGHSIATSDRAAGARVNALWQRVIADQEQRFGPMLFALALGGLFARRRDRVDAALGLMFLVQWMVWLFGTHLYARFAVPMLLPLGLLAGRSVAGQSARGRTTFVAVLLTLGCVWNAGFSVRREFRDSVAGVSASAMYEGRIPGYEYLRFVNQELPTDARILMIGDARPFYIQRPVDYWVVFNRHPLVGVLEGGATHEEAVQWLRDAGYTHVLVHWGEVRRLARTYGFPTCISPDRFDGLSQSGLTLTRGFAHPFGSERWIELYRVASESE